MYYEEKVIDGRLMSRSTPNGEWSPVSAENLTSLLLAARGRIMELQESADELL